MVRKDLRSYFENAYKRQRGNSYMDDNGYVGYYLCEYKEDRRLAVLQDIAVGRLPYVRGMRIFSILSSVEERC